MCGIGGILRVWPADQREVALRTPHDRSIPEAWLDILDDSIKHRGPDGQGRFRDRAVRADGCVVDVAFVHRRLSIIDHAGGHQPMVLTLPKTQGARSASSGPSRPIPGRILSVEEVTAHNRCVLAEGHAAPGVSAADPELALGALQSTDRVAVVFNGCIYNHRELRAELQRAGHVFSTDHSDTEVLVHGWREWQDRLHGRLDGMHAVAIWDSVFGNVFTVRDRFCEKPLMRSRFLGCEAFASSAAALLRLRCAAGGDAYSGGSRWAEWCMQGYSSIGPGEGIEEVWPSWVDMREPLDAGERWLTSASKRPSEQFSVEMADHLIRSAVESRLEADVPLGCLLSGGVDSSLVAAIAHRKSGNLRTFTVQMPSAEFDESAFGETAARCIGSQHTTVTCNPRPTDDIQMLIEQSGVPFGDSSLLPTFWANQAVGAVVRVALTGDGGDELFYGYDRYKVSDHFVPFGLFAAFVPSSLLNRSNPKSRSERLARLADAARAVDITDLERVFPRSMWRRLFGKNLLRTVWWCYNVQGERSGDVNAPGGLRQYDLLSYLPFDLLRKADMASMAVPVESRAPLLANELSAAAMCATLGSLKLGGQRKGLLRQVARKYLPAEIVDRPKMGFAIPIGEWFRSDYGGLRTMLLDHLNSTEPFGPPSLGIDLNMAFIRQMLDEHLGTGPSGVVKRDHSQRLYMLLVLSIWAKWVGGLR